MQRSPETCIPRGIDDAPPYEISGRRRRRVHPLLLRLLSPLFRFSYPRSAYVLRIGGGRHGPVLVPKPHD